MYIYIYSNLKNLVHGVVQISESFGLVNVYIFNGVYSFNAPQNIFFESYQLTLSNRRIYKLALPLLSSETPCLLSKLGFSYLMCTLLYLSER